MSNGWVTKFIVLRPDTVESALREVFRTDDFQKARYWLQYIAQPNDALCTTPLHPKHATGTQLGYKSHKISSGETAANEDQWKKLFGSLSSPNGQENELKQQ